MKSRFTKVVVASLCVGMLSSALSAGTSQALPFEAKRSQSLVSASVGAPIVKPQQRRVTAALVKVQAKSFRSLASSRLKSLKRMARSKAEKRAVSTASKQFASTDKRYRSSRKLSPRIPVIPVVLIAMRVAWMAKAAGFSLLKKCLRARVCTTFVNGSAHKLTAQTLSSAMAAANKRVSCLWGVPFTRDFIQCIVRGK